MKKILAIAAFLMISGFSLMSQTPPPPPNDPSNGGGTGPVGGGAPIGSGIVLLMTMAAWYCGHKVYKLKGSTYKKIEN
jgi:hypothetical protein